MSDTSIPIRDASLALVKRAVKQDADVMTPYNAEDPTQRAALLAAFVGLASDAKVEAVRALLAGTLAVKQPGAAYTETTVVLTAAQIAGTDPIVAANPNRRALVFGGAAHDFRISRNAGSATGLPVYGSSRDAIEAPVPIGALYLATGSGFTAGNTITVWEA